MMIYKMSYGKSNDAMNDEWMTNEARFLTETQSKKKNVASNSMLWRQSIVPVKQ